MCVHASSLRMSLWGGGLRGAGAQPRLDLGSGMSPPPTQAGSARTWENTHENLGILNEAHRDMGRCVEKNKQIYSWALSRAGAEAGFDT